MARTYFRDRYGRFASRGAKLYAVRGNKKKLVSKSPGRGTRQPHFMLAGIKIHAGREDRTRRGKTPRQINFKRAMGKIGAGQKRRRRPMTIQQISRETKTTRTGRAFPPMGALGRSGYGTGRRRTMLNIGKVKTGRVRRSTPRRIAMPRRRRGR